jgi:hypothetical protein
MLIFDENTKPIVLSDIHTPTITTHFWILDLDMLDFTIEPLTVFEEIISPAVELKIEDFKFVIPTSWNILIVGDDTCQLDIVEVSKALGKNFNAFVYGNNNASFNCSQIQATNYFPSMCSVSPLLTKHQLLCHPVAPDKWVCITPFDIYNKYLKGMLVGDLV